MKYEGMGSDVGQNPELVKQYTACVKSCVSIPVIPKMTPNITHITEPAAACLEAGADGLSAINTIKSVTMDVDAEVSGQLTVSGYSGRAVRPIAMRYVLELAQMPVQKADGTGRLELSGIGGIETWRDALEFIQLGCSNVQVCTAVMQYGYRIVEDMILGLRRYMVKRGVKELRELVGERVPKFTKPEALDRDTIIYPKFHSEKCVGCGRCVVSCNDGGHQALEFDATSRTPRLLGSKCVGCHLCRLVCPAGAIGVTKRVPHAVHLVPCPKDFPLRLLLVRAKRSIRLAEVRVGGDNHVVYSFGAGFLLYYQSESPYSYLSADLEVSYFCALAVRFIISNGSCSLSNFFLASSLILYFVWAGLAALLVFEVERILIFPIPPPLTIRTAFEVLFLSSTIPTLSPFTIRMAFELRP